MKLGLKSLLAELLHKLPIRNPLHFFKKKIYRYIFIGKVSKEPVRELVLKGAVNYKKVIDKEVFLITITSQLGHPEYIVT